MFVLIPKTAEDAPARHPKSARQMPKEVNSALELLGLSAEATFEEARQAYRDIIQQYHPDKVAHLGPELRKVADQKTKEIVAAYDQVKQFFAGSAE